MCYRIIGVFVARLHTGDCAGCLAPIHQLTVLSSTLLGENAIDVERRLSIPCSRIDHEMGNLESLNPRRCTSSVRRAAAAV